MVSQYQKSKPSAYTLFVIQRCKESKIPFSPRAFPKFGSEWKVLNQEKKALYVEEAKRQTKIMTEEKAAEIVNPTTRQKSVPFQGSKHTGLKRNLSCERAESGIHSDGEERHIKKRESREVTQRSTNRVFVGDDDGESFEEECVVADQKVLDVEAVMIPEAELFENAMDAYGSLEEITERAVVVISCTPALFAQGWKKASNKQVNRPVEISVSVFSVSQGLRDDWSHYFVNPGTLPVVAACDAEESGRGIHGIPLPGQFSDDCLPFHDNGFKLSMNYYSIYEHILQLSGHDGVHDILPPVFSTSAKVACDQACLRWLLIQGNIQAAEEGLPRLPELRFSTLEAFCRLAVFYRGSEQPEQCTASLIKGTFIRNTGRCHRLCLPQLCCTYHDTHNPTRVCALGAVREASYTALMILKNLFNLRQSDGRFVYLGRSFPAEGH